MYVAEITTKLAFPTLVQKLQTVGYTQAMTDMFELEQRIVVRLGNRLELAQLLSAFVFDEWMCVYLENRLQKMHSYLTCDEQEYLALLTVHFVKNTDDTYAGRTLSEWRYSLAQTFAFMMDAEQTIDIENVLRFRIKGCFEVINRQLEEAVSQFLADREYEEFVSMLQYILASQAPTNQIMHVYCSEERVWICDTMGNLVRDTDVTRAVELACDGEEMNAEDLTMSILIMYAPAQIILHDLFPQAPWPSFTHTVERVFSDKVIRCDGCSCCSLLQERSTTP